MIKAIPNIITSLSLLSGSMAIFMGFQGDMYLAGWFILIAAVLDFFDGFAARMLNAISPIGKFLDSLSDLVSFGVAPAIIYYFIIEGSSSHTSTTNANSIINYLKYAPLLLILASAFRLARFTVNTSQNDGFEGVPTTAIGIFTASLAIIYTTSKGLFWSEVFTNIYIISLVVIIVSILEVVKLPMLNLKFKHFGLKENIERYLLLVIAIITMIIFKWGAIPIVMAFYILISLLTGFKAKKTY
ncbi:MAG: CDP-alcohol phosphatidyltransferase family protein [Bacteroidales bacterium]|nr:CDP-alcohol phosphatidyltransferase family protein [Bacteroidales bacterium]